MSFLIWAPAKSSPLRLVILPVMLFTLGSVVKELARKQMENKMKIELNKFFTM